MRAEYWEHCLEWRRVGLLDKTLVVSSVETLGAECRVELLVHPWAECLDCCLDVRCRLRSWFRARSRGWLYTWG